MADEDLGLLPIGPTERRPVPDPTVMTAATIRREITLLRDSLNSDWDAYKTLVENKFQAIYEQFDVYERQRLELKADRIREVAESQRAQDIAVDRMRELSDERLRSIRVEIDHAVTSRYREVDAIMSANRKLIDTRFESILAQITLGDKARDEQKRDAEKNVDTARLQADKALTDFMERYQRAHDELWQMTNLAIEKLGRQVDDKFVAAEKLYYQQLAASDRAINKSEAATAEQLRLLSQPISDLKDRVGAIEAMRLGAAENRGEVRAQKDDSRGNIAIWIAAASVVLTIVLLILENSMKITGH
jgi:hypothetical protein